MNDLVLSKLEIKVFKFGGFNAFIGEIMVRYSSLLFRVFNAPSFSF